MCKIIHILYLAINRNENIRAEIEKSPALRGITETRPVRLVGVR